MKMYIKCQPEAKEIYGKLEACEGRNGHQIDRKIRHKRGRWVIVPGLDILKNKQWATVVSYALLKYFDF